jgi:hypothetical protein
MALINFNVPKHFATFPPKCSGFFWKKMTTFPTSLQNLTIVFPAKLKQGNAYNFGFEV